MFILAWTLSLNTYVNVGNSLNIHVHVDLLKMLCYITYQITVIYYKLLLIGLNAYNNNIVKIIVILVPNVIIINSLCLIHPIIMIKCLFHTTGNAIIWYGCACIFNVISVTLVINKLSFCSHIIHVLNLNGNEIIKVNRSNIISKPIAK